MMRGFQKNHPEYRTKESFMKLSESLKGRVVSPQTKQILSEATKTWHKSLSNEEKNVHIKQIITGMTNMNREKKNEWLIHLKKTQFKAGCKSDKKNKSYEQIFGEEKAQKIKQLISNKRRTQILPIKDTFIEVLIQDGLKKRGIKFEKHKLIENFVQCDIFIEPNIIIFADGCWFHGCQQCFPDRTKLSSIQNKDIIRDALVNQFFNYKVKDKYTVLRFWSHEIENDLEKVMNKIVATNEEVRKCSV